MPKKKNIIRIALWAVGVFFYTWFIIPVITGGILNLGNILGLFGFGALALYGIFFRKVNEFVKKICQSKKIKALLISLCVLACLCLALAADISVKMVASAKDAPTEASTLVILGCQVNGEKPSLMLTGRMNTAYEYLKENPDAKCVLSGGQGVGEDISEAECMYRYLTQKGIAPERLFKEENSTSTRENLRFSADIIRDGGLNPTVSIVTNEFHIYRSRIIAEKLGIKTFAVPAPTSWWLLPTFWVRDVCGVAAERCAAVVREQ